MGILFSHFVGYAPNCEDPDKSPNPIEKNIGVYKPYKPPQMVPDEADESAPVYVDFMEQIRVVPHKDGTCFVAYAGREVRCAEEGTANAFEVRSWEVNEYILKAIGIENPAECGGLAHPRIVKYLGRLTPGYKLEMFIPAAPGPLSTLRLPVLQIPISGDVSGSQIPLLLLLYYRWALQTLSALEFLHSHEVYLRDFGPSSVWIRPDLSSAVTGFMQAMFPGSELLDTDDFYPGTQGPDFRDIECEYDEDGNPIAYSARADICSWANFMWELVTNEHSMSPPRCPPDVNYPMVYPEDPRYWLDREGEPDWREEEDRLRRKMFQLLDEGRLGPILVKAWSGHYRSVTEVIADVRALLKNRGVNLVGGDEILVPAGDGNRSWDDIFVTVPGQYGNELRLRESRGLDSTWRATLAPSRE